MNKEETLALYERGKEAWNAWANELLARREDSEAWRDAAGASFVSHAFHDADFSGFVFPGYALFIGATFMGAARFDKTRFLSGARFKEVAFRGPVYFEHAVFEGAAEFEEMTFRGPVYSERVTFKGRAQLNKATFEGDVDFGWARFENEAAFKEATFKGFTLFQGATFKGDAEFNGATFRSATVFNGATFKGGAQFQETRFTDDVIFWQATFRGIARFELSTFEHGTSFSNATFCAEADFKAVQGDSAFTMTDAEFLEVPDFQQATFMQAPRLDNVRIGPQPSRWAKLKTFFKGDSEKEGRWRALKRLATQGHDHASEQLFFRGELLARRGVTDRYWHASFWLGLSYQIFSDFGRSLLRPLLWWAVGVLVFAGIYLSHHPRGGEWWLLECIAGTGKPWVAALGLSLHRSLPALSGFGDKLPQFHACLYGVHSESPFRPIIPDEVSFLSVPQVLFSAVMIFLFLLAVRNHFRIR